MPKFNILLLYYLNDGVTPCFIDRIMNFRGIKIVFFFTIIVAWTDSLWAQQQRLEAITFGDSIVAGLIRTTNGGTSAQCPPGVALAPSLSGSGNLRCFGNGAEGVGGFQPRLKSLIEDFNYDTSVYNRGYSGARTDDMVDLANGVLSSRPGSEFVLIMGGANDAFSAVSSSSVRFNLQTVVNKVCNRGMTPVLATITANRGSSTLNSRVNSYNNRIRNEISASSSCGLVKAEQNGALGTSSSNFESDNVHISAVGNAIMADVWFASMDLEDRGVNANAIVPAIMLLLSDDSDS